MKPFEYGIPAQNQLLQAKYRMTAWFYDILDYPWERMYRRWRPGLLQDVRGNVLEAGVGTGRNFKYYHPSVKLTGIDLSLAMLKRAGQRAKSAACDIKLSHEDATVMQAVPSNYFDFLISTFLCCVMPDPLQPLAVKQFERVLKPGGKFRILEMVYPKDPKRRRRLEFSAPFVEKVYGARFDRNTLEYLKNSKLLEVERTYFLKGEIYLVIEGRKRV